MITVHARNLRRNLPPKVIITLNSTLYTLNYTVISPDPKQR